MGKLRDAARDYWAAIFAFGGAIIAAYNVVDQLVKFGLVTNHRIWITGLLIFLLFGTIEIIRSTANERKYKNNLPNIVLEHPYVDERAVTIPGKEYPIVDSSRTGSSSAISPYERVPKGVDRIEKYYFAHAVFTNKPPAGNARNCIPEIEFYDEHMNSLPDHLDFAFCKLVLGNIYTGEYNNTIKGENGVNLAIRNIVKSTRQNGVICLVERDTMNFTSFLQNARLTPLRICRISRGDIGTFGRLTSSVSIVNYVVYLCKKYQEE